MHAQILENKLMTDLTCWKCGEEALVETPGTAAAPLQAGAPVIAAGGRYSICGKCGTRSVNAVQARHNKTASKKTRKAQIREANRKLA